MLTEAKLVFPQWGEKLMESLPFCVFLKIIFTIHFLKKFILEKFKIEVQLIYKVVLVSGVQPSDSVLNINLLFQILFHY